MITVRSPEQEVHPLSFSQTRIWFLDQVSPGDVAYNVSCAYRLRGTLDAEAFSAAFADLVQRHESLRSRIITSTGSPGQVILTDIPVIIPSEPVTGTQEARMLAEQVAAQPFDLAAAPLYRVRLLRIANNDHVFAFTIHHIICDGWSIDVLWRDLARFYSARITGAEPDLPAIVLRYTDHVAVERRRHDDDHVASELGYWRGKLAGLAPLQLPTDRVRTDGHLAGGARIPLTLSAELAARIDDLSRRHRVTRFMTLLATFQALLARWSGQEDIAVGTPVAGRLTRGTEPLVGLFANTLVLRTDLSGDPPFEDLLARVREVVLDAVDHQDLPFDQLVAELRPSRDLARHPFFQVMLSVQDKALVPSLAGLQVERVALERDSAQFDLSLSLFAGESGMHGEIEYATDLFDEATVRCLAEQFITLLETVTGCRGQRVSTAALCSSSLPPAGAAVAPDRTLAQLLELGATLAPGSPAIVADADEISYADLNSWVDGLAGVLRQHGVGPEVLVGLYGQRSPELAVGMLAILKAGGACLPLSPQLPAERIRRVLHGSGVRLIMAAASDPPEDLGVPVVPVPIRPAVPAASLPGLPVGLAKTDNLAFVLPTSGSSGEPKLVALTHQNLSAFVTTVLRSYQLGPADRLLSFWPHGSDGSIEEICLTICGGATLILSGNLVETPARFARLCRQLGITVLMLPTAYWHQLTADLGELASALPESVRLVTFGGERALPDRVIDWLSTWPRIRLVNEYGPSETTIFATKHEPSAAPLARHVPIGKPLEGVGAYVLDRMLRQVPAGVVGELYLSGPLVARGYLGNPAETATRFVADPRGSGNRMFRTGDLARAAADGTLEFLGRADRQVKVRGYRIEPEEIERSLAADRDVTAAAVIGDGTGLTGYVVTGTDLGQIRKRLAERLPEYMVPARLIGLSRLPMTATGKIDRRALAALRPPTVRSTEKPVAPRTATERRLAALWQQILGLDEIGVLDSFYDLGAHSLQAVQLAAAVATAFGVEIPVADLLQRSTIAAIAEDIEMQTGSTCPGLPAKLAVPQSAAGVDFRKFVTRPLLVLIDTGEIPPVDAASISCIPERALAQRELTAEQYIEDWCQGVPIISGIKQTPVGRIAQVVIPYLERDVFGDPSSLISTLIPGLRLARRAGAKVVSLINLLSPATSYGTLVHEAAGQRADLPEVTTGHAMTTAAVLLNLRRVFAETHRAMSGEDLAVLGLGSIGQSVLRLALRRMDHPRRLFLCDLYGRHAQLEQIRDEVRDLGFGGPVDVLFSPVGSVPDQLYDASAIVAATNVPDVLDVERLRPGCIVVDDSVPHCFNPARAMARLDVLCAEGGELHSTSPMNELRYVPRWATEGRTWESIDGWYEQDPYRFGGCVLAAGLAARREDVPVSVGVPNLATCEQALDLLPRVGFHAVPPQCDDVVYTSDQLARVGRGIT
jgi:amino acid adenylation domain-containing protein